MKSQPTNRTKNLAAMGVLFAAMFLSLASFARIPVQNKQLAREQFQAAEKIREQLDSTPEAQRSRRDYQRATEAYRRVYYLSPVSSKSDEAVVAVGDLLAETGRRFDDRGTLQAAIGQYEFLRREYPGSKFRVSALFAIGLIYRNDLNDPEKAKSTFQEYLKRYPHGEMADNARRFLAELGRPAAAKKATRSATSEAPFTAVRDAVLGAPASRRESTVRNPADVAPVEAPVPVPTPVSLPEEKAQKVEHKSSMPLVTGVRYWSTPNYTRVAIDLETEVKYEAGRIANPDRIFFDLHDTKLASGLMGKTFDVEDGFLRKIRVAQYQRGLTRVVLDVDDVSDYSAFLLPNPYRLIIDIHGKKPGRTLAKTEETTSGSKPGVGMSTALQNSGKDNTGTLNASTATTTNRVAPSTTKDVAPPEPMKSAAAKSEPTKVDTGLASAMTKQPANDPVIAKPGQPELKVTTKPTSAPTFESVAPRDEILPKSTHRKHKPQSELAREARPTSNGERSLTRALGLKIGRIVVDAGHGGHDTGTVGPSGLQEKDLVLDVALRLGKLLQTHMGADVVYTRSDDTFIPLETRTAIANQQQADLFISIHANSSRDPSARGVETYYLNFTSSPEALEVAARENAVSEKSIHELQDLVKKITLKDKIDESREFAADVQRSLYSGVAAKSPAIRNRGVKKAPFIVLIGANMPSILAEISFVSNPTDEKRLFTPDYRQRIAEYLYRGINLYTDGLSGLKVASRTSSAAITSKSEQ